MKKIFDIVYEANKDRRHHTNIERRSMKTMEELGELCNAYLSVTSKLNRKQKTWTNVREEMVDTLIMAIDLLYTPFPGGENKTKEEIEQEVFEAFNVAMKKWQDQISNEEDITMS